jgi:SAM-dependent methyltransferase/uncharacterized protein YbaR (Trm112 family)
MHIRNSAALRDFRDGGRSRFELSIFTRERDRVVEGVLTATDGRWYPIVSGVPCLLEGDLRPDSKAFAERHGLRLDQPVGGRLVNEARIHTQSSFSEKWRRIRKYGLGSAEREFLLDWYCKKLGLPDQAALAAFYRDRANVLEVGTGSGFNTRFIAENCRGEVYALDISTAAFTTFENTSDLDNCTVVQGDLLEAPFADGYFDFIIADGVLHHTPNTRDAFRAVYRKLKPKGQFFFYVYRKMGAARQFVDQHIRSHFMKLEPEECYEACEALTELGRELSRIRSQVTLRKPIPILGIPAGTHDVQRLLYYNFVKCFWNEAYDYETNNMVNFDWYHPHYAWQHTQEEVEEWLKELNVRDYRFNDANPNGISVLLTKPED